MVRPADRGRGSGLRTRPVAEIIELGVKRGEIRPDIDADLAEQIITTAYFSIVLQWIDTEPPFSLDARLNEMIDQVLHGVLSNGTGPDPG